MSNSTLFNKFEKLEDELQVRIEENDDDNYSQVANNFKETKLHHMQGGTSRFEKVLAFFQSNRTQQSKEFVFSVLIVSITLMNSLPIYYKQSSAVLLLLLYFHWIMLSCSRTGVIMVG